MSSKNNGIIARLCSLEADSSISNIDIQTLDVYIVSSSTFTYAKICFHYNDVIMTAMTSQFTSLTIVY